MLLTVKKQVQVDETIEIKCPAYYKDCYGFYYHVTDNSKIIRLSHCLIVVWDLSDKHSQSVLADMLKGEEIESTEFNEIFETTMESIKNLIPAVV